MLFMFGFELYPGVNVPGGGEKKYSTGVFGVGDVNTFDTCILVILLVEQPTVKLVGLVTVN